MCCSMFVVSVVGYTASQLRSHWLTKTVSARTATVLCPASVQRSPTVTLLSARLPLSQPPHTSHGRSSTAVSPHSLTLRPPPPCVPCADGVVSAARAAAASAAGAVCVCVVRVLGARPVAAVAPLLPAAALLCRLRGGGVRSGEPPPVCERGGDGPLAAAEEELDAVTQRATQSTYQAAEHQLQHEKETQCRHDSWV